MSYFNKQKTMQQQSRKPAQKDALLGKKPLPNSNNNKKYQQINGMEPEREEPEGKVLKFSEDEVVFIENVLVKLETLIPNEQGENEELMEMITTAQQIISARLDVEAGMIGDSA